MKNINKIFVVIAVIIVLFFITCKMSTVGRDNFNKIRLEVTPKQGIIPLKCKINIIDEENKVDVNKLYLTINGIKIDAGKKEYLFKYPGKHKIALHYTNDTQNITIDAVSVDSEDTWLSVRFRNLIKENFLMPSNITSNNKTEYELDLRDIIIPYNLNNSNYEIVQQSISKKIFSIYKQQFYENSKMNELIKQAASKHKWELEKYNTRLFKDLNVDFALYNDITVVDKYRVKVVFIEMNKTNINNTLRKRSIALLQKIATEESSLREKIYRYLNAEGVEPSEFRLKFAFDLQNIFSEGETDLKKLFEENLKIIFENMMKEYFSQYDENVELKTEVEIPANTEYITMINFKTNSPLDLNTLEVYSPEGKIKINRRKETRKEDEVDYGYILQLKNKVKNNENVIVTSIDINTGKRYALNITPDNYVVKQITDKNFSITFGIKSKINNYLLANKFLDKLNETAGRDGILSFDKLVNNFIQNHEVKDLYNKNIKEQDMKINLIVEYDNNRNKINLVTKVNYVEEPETHKLIIKSGLPKAKMLDWKVIQLNALAETNLNKILKTLDYIYDPKKVSFKRKSNMLRFPHGNLKEIKNITNRLEKTEILKRLYAECYSISDDNGVFTGTGESVNIIFKSGNSNSEIIKLAILYRTYSNDKGIFVRFYLFPYTKSENYTDYMTGDVLEITNFNFDEFKQEIEIEKNKKIRLKNITQYYVDKYFNIYDKLTRGSISEIDKRGLKNLIKNCDRQDEFLDFKGNIEDIETCLFNGEDNNLYAVVNLNYPDGLSFQEKLKKLYIQYSILYNKFPENKLLSPVKVWIDRVANMDIRVHTDYFISGPYVYALVKYIDYTEKQVKNILAGLSENQSEIIRKEKKEVPFILNNIYEYNQTKKITNEQWKQMVEADSRYLNNFMKDFNLGNNITIKERDFSFENVLAKISYFSGNKMDIFKFSFRDESEKEFNLVPSIGKYIDNEIRYHYDFFPGPAAVLKYEKPLYIYYDGKQIQANPKNVNYGKETTKNRVEFDGVFYGDVEEALNELAKPFEYRYLAAGIRNYNRKFNVEWNNITWKFDMEIQSIFATNTKQVRYSLENIRPQDNAKWHFLYGGQISKIANNNLNNLFDRLNFVKDNIHPRQIFNQNQDFIKNNLAVLLINNGIEQGRVAETKYIPQGNEELITIRWPDPLKEEAWPGIIGFRELINGYQFFIIPNYIFNLDEQSRKNQITSYLTKITSE